MFTTACFGRRDKGANSILKNPYFGYTNYYSQSFPSGDFKKINFFETKFHWWYKPYISFMISYQHYKISRQLHNRN